jgi:hypothetical protein
MGDLNWLHITAVFVTCVRYRTSIQEKYVFQQVHGLILWWSTNVLDNRYQRLKIVTLIIVILLIQIMDTLELKNRIICWTVMPFADLFQYVYLGKVGSHWFMLHNMRTWKVGMHLEGKESWYVNVL